METIKYDILNKESEFISDNEDRLNPLFFDTLEFHKYHQCKCEKVYRILNYKKSKVIAVYYFGIKEGNLLMPYSSPFSQILFNDNTSYNDFLLIIDGMYNICKKLNLISIHISLPPFIYNRKIEKEFLMFLEYGFNIDYIDINHYYDLDKFTIKDEFVNKLPRAQRINYRKTIKQGLKFYKVDNSNFEEAFEVIEISRKEKQYPLKMNRQQIKDILNLKNSNIEFFVIENEDDKKIAAAMVYQVNDNIYQVIYWGHIAKYEIQRPMSLLSISLCEYYKEKGAKYLDLGPSSEKGVFNYGLCKFKSSIGCEETSKFSLKLEIK